MLKVKPFELNTRKAKQFNFSYGLIFLFIENNLTKSTEKKIVKLLHKLIDLDFIVQHENKSLT